MNSPAAPRSTEPSCLDPDESGVKRGHHAPTLPPALQPPDVEPDESAEVPQRDPGDQRERDTVRARRRQLRGTDAGLGDVDAAAPSAPDAADARGPAALDLHADSAGAADRASSPDPDVY